MAHRMDIELTSSRDDGSWTWRKAGARQPKGSLDGSLLWAGAAVGDVVKAECENLLDGIAQRVTNTTHQAALQAAFHVTRLDNADL